ncbi:MAG: hypothetical protein WC028_27445 [Candidatus Obscuribacterales bacterium]
MSQKKITLQTCAVISMLALAHPSASGQALGEFGGLNAGLFGVGAGAAAMTQQRPQRTNYVNPAQAQQYFAMQNRAVEQYSKLGNQYELKKQWENAERTFAYVLQIINMRDGVDSQKSIVPLKHLVTASDAQHKVKQAIYYQTNVLKVTKAAKTPARTAVVQESVSLSNLLIKDKDYPAAENLLKQSVALAKQAPALAKERTISLVVLGKVYKAQNKTQEALAVESELIQNAQNDTAASTPANTSTSSLAPSAAASTSTATQPATDTATSSSPAAPPLADTTTSGSTAAQPAADTMTSSAPAAQPATDAATSSAPATQPAADAATSSAPATQPAADTTTSSSTPQPTSDAATSSALPSPDTPASPATTVPSSP